MQKQPDNSEDLKPQSESKEKKTKIFNIEEDLYEEVPELKVKNPYRFNKIQRVPLQNLKNLLYSQYPNFDEFEFGMHKVWDEKTNKHKEVPRYDWESLRASMRTGYNPEKYGYIILGRRFGKLTLINGYHRVRVLLDKYPLTKAIEVRLARSMNKPFRLPKSKPPRRDE